MLLSYEYLDVFVGVLKTIRRENGAETYKKQFGILCYLRTRLARLSRCALIAVVSMKVIPSGCFKEEKRVPIICWLAINFAITNKEIRKLCLMLRSEIN